MSGHELQRALVALGAYLLYTFLTLTRRGRHNGQTLGKQMMSLRVIRDDRQAVGFSTVLVREVLFKGVVDGATLGVGALFDYLWPLGERTNRALHDKVAGTHVISRKRGSGAAAIIVGLLPMLGIAIAIASPSFYKQTLPPATPTTISPAVPAAPPVNPADPSRLSKGESNSLIAEAIKVQQAGVTLEECGQVNETSTTVPSCFVPDATATITTENDFEADITRAQGRVSPGVCRQALNQWRLFLPTVSANIQNLLSAAEDSNASAVESSNTQDPEIEQREAMLSKKFPLQPCFTQ